MDLHVCLFSSNLIKSKYCVVKKAKGQMKDCTYMLIIF